ncbi:MAG: SGNH/GDSL hydrolase family protein [Geminicoccaceae bacterium]|nr:SGNH/GDSL hydrolase family protein [Geminicoccaceae bacterium]
MRLGRAEIALLLASVFFFLLAAELVLRLFPHLLSEEAQLRLHWAAIAGDTDTSGRDMLSDDPEIGFLYRPHSQGRIARDDLDFSFRLDSFGFRNPEPRPAKADLVILGDSMAFGYGASDGRDWVSLLRARFPELAIVNLGLIGSGPLQQLAVYERFGRPLAPALVVQVVFAGNDVHDDETFARWQETGRTRSFRRFRVEGEGRLVDRLWNLAGRSYLFWFAVDLVKALRQSGRGRSLLLENGERLRLVLPARGYPGPAGVERTAAAIARLRQRVEADGGRFLAVLMPSKEEVYLPLLGESAPSPSAILGERLASLGIPLFDLGDPLRAGASRHGPALFFRVDGHPNLAGQARIAEVFAARLSAWRTETGKTALAREREAGEER